MADVATHSISSISLLTTIAALREHFSRHFDRGWLAMIIDDLPIDFTTLRQIRQLLTVTEVYPEDLSTVRFGADQLRHFAADLRRYLLPVIRERLGVSELLPSRPRLDEVQRVHRQLLCLSFPYNLTRLEELTTELLSLTDASIQA
jgi:hypothetical protein